MEDITDEDPETAYDLLVTRKQMPIPKEFLDITWDGSSAREVLRLVIDRIKILANSEEPEKIWKCRRSSGTLWTIGAWQTRSSGEISFQRTSENLRFSLRHLPDVGFPE
ncbi:unnamed protein product [Cylindrotheca closterium]|uniref:Uncharacterized protein n=1 Tax=Cylindrotheca closterium TaxID=2856 RepID=A0AAD2CHQ3_9STRA|nr:unnamed protein product [Cylindrotheca closterium]